MLMKCLKITVLVLVIVALVGVLFFGKDLKSYIHSSARSVQHVVKDAIPIEFELRRAHDLLEEIIPEMHANVRLIAEEEVEIAALNSEIEQAQVSLAEERRRIENMRNVLSTPKTSYSFSGHHYSRTEITEELAGRFDRFKEAEMIFASKERLLTNREKALQASLQLLEKTRAQKRLLEDRISAMEGQCRLVRAAAVGSRLNIDNSKLAQTEKLIQQIKKRLDVAERVLAHETRFIEPLPVPTVTEQDLLTQIDEHFCEHPEKDTGALDGAPMARSVDRAQISPDS
jgi:hypothetical protein